MRLLHVTTLRLSLVAAILLTFWSFLFYHALMIEITDEVDDSLEDYAEMIMKRDLRGEQLPRSANGTNNHYYLREVSETYANTTSRIRYANREIYLTAKDEVEPARVLTYIYMRDDGTYVELIVATPNIDRDDLRESIAFWLLFLYVILILCIALANLWGIRRTMRPLTHLLEWLNSYRLGQHNRPLNNPTRIEEFRQLNQTVAESIHRGEELYEQQKTFIGNASHEMQTPIAICRNRIELLLDDDSLSEQQMGELVKVNRTLGQLTRLNKSLLLLCKIENGQFDAGEPQNLTLKLQRMLSDYEAVYASRGFAVQWQGEGEMTVPMDEGMAETLLSNLLKNAFVHNAEKGTVRIATSSECIIVANTATEGPLPADRIFQRFYHTGDRSVSSGLGLALVEAICKQSALKISYSFEAGMHCFMLTRNA